MGFTIEIANMDHAATELELRLLVKSAFRSASLLPDRYMLNNIASHASRQSFFLVAKAGNEIIGCNAFLANDFTLDGKPYVGYQSCWSATHPAHQGKGVFMAIIDAAKKILREEQAGFIYGVANDNSHPIFTKKLGFSEIPAVIARIPNTPFTRQLYIGDSNSNTAGCCIINEQQVMAHKFSQSPSAIKKLTINGSMIWGKISQRKKLGIPLSVFEIGGIELVDAKDLPLLIKNIFKTYSVSFMQVLSPVTNSRNSLFKKWKPSAMNGFIFYPLAIPSFTHFNLMGGAVDVF